MQLPYLFRRGIIRPLDDCAAQQLARFRIDGPIRVEWLPIPSDEQFAELWGSGVLQRINNACGIRISDYDEEELPANQLEVSIQIVRTEIRSGVSASPFFEKLEALLSDAFATQQSVYFIL